MSVGSFLVKEGVLFVPKDDLFGLRTSRNFYISLAISTIITLIFFIGGEPVLAFMFGCLFYLLSFIFVFPNGFVNLKTLFINDEGIEYESHSSRFNQYGIQNRDFILDYDSEKCFFKAKWQDIKQVSISKKNLGYQIQFKTNQQNFNVIIYNWTLAENQENKVRKYDIHLPKEINNGNIIKLMIDAIINFNPSDNKINIEDKINVFNSNGRFS